MTDLTQHQNDLHCVATNILWITSIYRRQHLSLQHNDLFRLKAERQRWGMGRMLEAGMPHPSYLLIVAPSYPQYILCTIYYTVPLSVQYSVLPQSITLCPVLSSVCWVQIASKSKTQSHSPAPSCPLSLSVSTLLWNFAISEVGTANHIEKCAFLRTILLSTFSRNSAGRLNSAVLWIRLALNFDRGLTWYK